MKIYTRKYTSLMENIVEEIDDKIQDFIEKYTGRGDLDDEDIQEEIADIIIEKLEELELLDKSNKLYKIIKSEIILNYVNYMFSQWYTGESNEVDYNISISKLVD